jgi:putative ABC transport system permease protein
MRNPVTLVPRVVESLFKDIGYACRGLGRSPALVMTCVLSLGLGIGVNATIFTALRSVMFYQPTLTDPDSVVGVEPGNGNQLSYANYRDLRASGIFANVLAYRVVRANLRIGGTGERVIGALVTDNFFSTLGVQAHAGRTFVAEDGVPARHSRVAVLSDTFWRRRFGADHAVIGRTVHVNGEPVDIVGILPGGYRSVTPLGAPDVYLPISELFLAGLEHRENANGFNLIARLREGDTPQRAQMAVTSLGRELERQYPEANRGLGEQAAVFPLRDLMLRGAPPEVLLLPVIVVVLFGLVLLIACGNVAGLLLARAATRRHEIAVRLALGAKRGRLVQALLAEALVLGFVSAAGGVLLTLGAIPILNALTLPGQMALRLSIAPDVSLLAYALFLAIVTTVTCGLAPAIGATRVNVVSDLHDAGTRATGRLRLRHAFVIGQVALSAFLVVLSGLFLRTAVRAAGLEPGFDLDRSVVVRVALDPRRSNESRVALARQLTEGVLSLPDVRSASTANILPLAGDVVTRRFEVSEREGGPGVPTYVNAVGPGYFTTMGITRLHGREFRWTDRPGAPPVVIVNQAFAARYVAGDDPLAMRIRTGDEPYAEIVGVVADTKFLLLTEDPHPLVYYSYAQRPWDPIVHVSVAGSPEASVGAIRATAERLDPTAIVAVETLRQATGLEIALRRGAGMLLAALGSLGLLLALVGLYGVMAHTVTARRVEIGVRMALGASAGHVLSLIVRRALTLTAIGLSIGVSASLLLTIPLRTMLAGVSPVDPLALATTATALLVGGVCASYLPARRATRVDPMVALRQ